MAAKRYPAIEVKQQPEAAPMYLLAVTAPDLLTWCDVPRTKENYMAGYQRLLSDDRASEITDYLNESPKNVLPGAIIVATDKEYVSVVLIDGRTYIEVREDPRDYEAKLQELFGAFSTRLSPEELDSANIEVSTPGITNDEDVASAQAEAEEDAEDESTYPTSYIASLARELNLALTDPASLSPERQAAIKDYIDGVSKPGLIIDGQHRVIGAKNVSDHDIVLPIIVLHGLPHEEQVFQFYVLNSKAKPLKATELRRIISTSLTNPEIDDLYKRFRSAGINALESRWTYEMNTSNDSVFKDLIDFGFGTSNAVIPENVADQLVRAFMRMPRARYKTLIDAVDERWVNPEERLEIFFDFWRAISEVYEDVWTIAKTKAATGEKHQLFMKVSLLTLQKFLLDRFVTALPYRSKTAPAPFSSKEAIKEMVESTLENLPSAFFSREWKAKQIDTSEGRALLYETMAKVWDNAGKNYAYQKLFKG